MLFRMTLPAGVYEYVSPAVVDISGYSQEEFLATPRLLAKITHNEWTDYVSDRWLCAIQGDTISGCEFQIVHKSGELRWLSQRCTIIKDDDGTPLAMEGIISDITERMRIDAALQESERRYRTLLDSSPDWIWEVDVNGVYTYASHKVEELLGYTPEELIGNTPFDLMSPAEAERVGAAFGEIVAEKRAFHNLENTNRHKDGHLVVLETSGTPILSEEGELLGYRGVDRDITARKQNEHELRVERDFNSTVLEAAGNVIVVLDMAGNFLRFNRAAEELTGYSRDEVIGRPVWELVIPHEQRMGVRGVFDTLREGDVDLGGEYENEWLTRDGRRRLLHWHNSMLYDDEGKISNIVALGYDITEHRKLEHSLRAQEQELAQIIDHIPNMIFLKEANELRYVRFNSAGEQLTGVSREDIIGRNDHDFFPAEQADFFKEKDRKVLGSAQMEDIPEEPLDTPHGTRILHTRKVAIRDENGKPKYLLGISDDITNRKEEEKEHARLQRELQQAQKMESLGQLTGGIAHDFNNLLGIINGYAGLALDNCVERGEEKLVGYMEHLKGAGERATNLVSQMLAFSRSEQADDAPIDFAPLLKEDIKMLRSTLPSTIQMKSEIEPNLPPVVMNPTQLHQILMNLSINARDAMKGGERSPSNLAGRVICIPSRRSRTNR
jgi:PAS domain S-box-containing protein